MPDYRRTPLPEHARTPVGWIALCIMGLVFSPFVGFAVHGQVAAPGLSIGLLFALAPLVGLCAIALRRWQAWRRLPRSVVEEWTVGRLVPADGAPHVVSPVRFSDGRDWIEIQPDGVTLARHTLLTMQGVSQAMARLWIAEQTGQVFIPWSDIREWVVDTDNDGPDPHLLKLGADGTIRARRFRPDTATECDLLDAVRSVGHRPVRIRCDVECERHTRGRSRTRAATSGLQGKLPG